MLNIKQFTNNIYGSNEIKDDLYFNNKIMKRIKGILQKGKKK